MSGVVDEFTVSSARQVEIAHKDDLDISIAAWGPLVITTPWVRFGFVMRAWSTAEMRAVVLFMAVTFLATGQAVRLIVDDVIMTIVAICRRDRLTPFVMVSGARIVAVARIEIKHRDLPNELATVPNRTVPFQTHDRVCVDMQLRTRPK